MRTSQAVAFVVCTFFVPAFVWSQHNPKRADIAAALQELSARLAAKEEPQDVRQSLGRSLRDVIAAANRRSSDQWSNVASREDWERLRAEKLQALRTSLGTFSERPAVPKLLVTGTIQGDGFRIQNLVYESRPGLVVTANLYVSAPPRSDMPGILLSHSHHNPKHEGELQDMGMTWARAGCYVLVPDHLGHGERRQHPFATAADFGRPFQIGRQDYYFRYDTSLQLYLVGESLMGWLVHDLMTGVDVLLSQPGIDPKRIALLGSVAGGGDPAAVTAALDERIACVVPFNFGGPQPENRYPLPEDAEATFNYAGSGSWESTRNLAGSARGGFLPWVIVGGVAPRKLIHAHEFSWDREHDPVWKRYQRIWSFYDAAENLAFTHGHGTIQNASAPASHCNNIGAEHRRHIHEAFRRWLAIDVQPEDEYKHRRTREELTCLTDEARRQFQPQLLHEILAAIADRQLAAARQALAGAGPEERRKIMQKRWTRLLGDTQPPVKARVLDGSRLVETAGPISATRELLEVEPGIAAGVLTLRRAEAESARPDAPLLLVVAADGIRPALQRQRDQIAVALIAGQTIVLAEVRGIGAGNPATDRGQQSEATAHSATALMLGQPLLGRQLRDLRTVWRHVRPQRNAGSAIVLGDSGVTPLPHGASFAFPRRIDERPAECRPTGALLAALVALYEDDFRSVVCRRGLASYRSALDSQFVQVPHEAIVPGILREGDIADLLAALAPAAVEQVETVDGLGRIVQLP